VELRVHRVSLGDCTPDQDILAGLQIGLVNRWIPLYLCFARRNGKEITLLETETVGFVCWNLASFEYTLTGDTARAF
jgi:hypothetical protein